MIALPATPRTLLDEVIDPELAQMPLSLRANAARIVLVAIALQETSLATRVQAGGPAHSFWQFEKGGIHAVMTHPAVSAAADDACERHGVPFEVEPVYQALSHDDGLGAAFARLLVRADPFALPFTEGDAWDLYLRAWRPGQKGREAFDRKRWTRSFRLAEEAVL